MFSQTLSNLFSCCCCVLSGSILSSEGQSVLHWSQCYIKIFPEERQLHYPTLPPIFCYQCFPFTLASWVTANTVLLLLLLFLFFFFFFLFFFFSFSIFLGCVNTLYASNSSDGWLSSWNRQGPPCTWTITAPVGQRVLLNFDKLQISSFSSCNSYLEVRDGQYSFSNLLVKYCASPTSPSPVYSSERYLFVKFYNRVGWLHLTNHNGVSAKFRALPASSQGNINIWILLGN